MNLRITQFRTAIFAALMFSACTKIETTEIGSELIPVVDNVKTFETVLDVIGNNYLDTLTYRLNSSNPHIVGGITQENVFGNSSASIYFQMMPATFPYIFPRDSIEGNSKVGFDSAVLILTYQGYYGDSALPANFKLYQADKSLQPDAGVTPYYTFNPDVNANPAILWGEKTIGANRLRDTITLVRKSDTTKVVNQLRIRLDSAMARKLLTADPSNYVSDTAFREYFPGFALVTEGPVNSLFYFSMLSSSKIEFFFRQNPNLVKQDTTSVSFTLTSKAGHAMRFINDYSGSELSSHLVTDANKGDDHLYVQSAPGTYVTLRIPGLDTFSKVNRVIHKAELRVIQDQALPDTQYRVPQALYLDLMDTAEKTYRGIPYDLSPYSNYYCYPTSNSGVDFNYFGGKARLENVNNESKYVYNFNIARYLQGAVTRKEKLSPLFRLWAPFYMFYQDCSNNSSTYPAQVFPYISGSSLLNPPGSGRIKVAGGGTGVIPEKRMQLRIIYSVL